MKNLNIIVRPAEPGDAADIAELGARTFLKAFAAGNSAEDIHAYVEDAFNVGTIDRELRDPRSIFLLAVRGGRNIGYGKLRKCRAPACVDGPGPIELERIYVDGDQQGNGVGAMLMRAAIDCAKAQGCGTIWLGAWEKNARARRFYEKQGFTAVGSKYFVVGNDRQNDVVMRRMLE